MRSLWPRTVLISLQFQDRIDQCTSYVHLVDQIPNQPPCPQALLDRFPNVHCDGITHSRDNSISSLSRAPFCPRLVMGTGLF